MAWLNSFPSSASKKDYIGKKVSITGTEPTPIGKGMFEVELWDDVDKKKVCIILTRRDLTEIQKGKKTEFTFVTDPKNPEWANVKTL